ncbi:hypothetical protein [Streptomonospora litoralis]|uniref:Uncharacterized protein n=1 Tax=Streptomonospora litoralis TaxID=2498135 RepID=A0A4P6Q4X5_9ACTN|nr:hypothetical protein [Streptomonospora litoralis]QBI54401.1 hypothetical protein EKD16_13095 [Streptomonospora litoralis]
MNPDASIEGILAELPLYAPARDRRRGRISSTTLEPGGGGLLKAVVDFGSTPEGPDTGPDIEIATRLRGPDPTAAERELRAFCGERDLMERRARDPAAAHSFALPADAAWSQQTIALDGRAHTFTVLATSATWVAAACVGEAVMVRVFTPAPGPGPDELRRIGDPGELEPLRGRG